MKTLASPNQAPRQRGVVNLILIHATAGATLEGAVGWMMNPKSQVSSHYCIGKVGEVVKLVDESKKAWHAGASKWDGESNLNEVSVGIELVNLNDGVDPYPDIQILTLAQLIVEIQKRHPAVQDERIVGHHQVAPGRKTDPGVLFPWVKLGALLESLRKS